MGSVSDLKSVIKKQFAAKLPDNGMNYLSKNYTQCTCDMQWE